MTVAMLETTEVTEQGLAVEKRITGEAQVRDAAGVDAEPEHEAERRA